MSIFDKYKSSIPSDEKTLGLLEPFKGHDKVVMLQPGGWVYLPGYPKYADAYAQFKIYPDDVWVSTMPKSGTTWVQEIVWTMRNNPTLDEAKMAVPLHIRCPNLEVDMTIEHVNKPQTLLDMFSTTYPDYDIAKGIFIHLVRHSTRPRTIKSHMPFELLNPKLLDTAKVVYVIRDPRDVCLSYLHHSRIFFYESFRGTLDEYVNAFIGDMVTYGPYWAHVSQAWALRHHPNMCVTFYEKLKKNPKSEYEKLNKFLGTELSPDQIDKVIHFTSFEEMKNRKQHCITVKDEKDFIDAALEQRDGGFFRQGTSGGWRKVLTQDQKDKFEEWITRKCPDKEIMENILNP